MQSPKVPLLLKQSSLVIKRGLIPTRRHVTLSAPRTMQEVQTVFEACFVKDPFEAIQTKAIPWLGAITMAASSRAPLLIISSSEKYEDPIFIPLDSSLSLREEMDLSKPCCFEIMVDKDRILFCFKSSVEYLEWIGVLRIAVEMSRGVNVPMNLGLNSLNR